MTKVNFLKEKLKNIQTYIDNFENQQLSKIDIDILLQKIRDFYEEIIELQNSNDPIKNEDEQKTIENIVIEAQISNQTETIILESHNTNTPIREEEIIEFAEDKEPKQQKITETKTPSYDYDFKTETKQTDSINISKNKEAHQTTLFDTNNKSNIIGEKLGSNKRSLNESFAERSNQNHITNKLKSISDIRVGIGVGDRFLFVRELFDGNLQKFEQEIDLLNSLNSYNDAISHLNTNFHWDKSSSTVDSFMSVIKRRFHETS